MAGRASIVGAAATHVGKVRDHNEDAYHFDADAGLFLVCDGMGGHAAGEVASALAVKTIRAKWLDEQVLRLADAWLAQRTAEAKKQLFGVLRAGVIAAHDQILAEGAEDDAKSGMGTTVVGAIVVGSELVFAHAGDSRAYLVRDGIAMQLTEDHTLLARLLAAGIDVDVSGEGARFRSMLTNALGIGQECKVATFVVPLADGDLFLLCSDGISEYIPEAEVGTVLTKQASPARAAEQLVELALARGGGDNATVVVIRVVEAGEGPQPAEHRRLDDEAIQRCPLWGAKITPQQRLRALRIAIPRDHGAGERVPAHTLGDRVAWIVLEGALSHDGKELGPGALVYPESLVSDGPGPERDALAVARSDVRALALRADDFRELCDDDTELGEALLENVGTLVSGRRRPGRITRGNERADTVIERERAPSNSDVIDPPPPVMAPLPITARPSPTPQQSAQDQAPQRPAPRTSPPHPPPGAPPGAPPEAPTQAQQRSPSSPLDRPSPSTQAQQRSPSSSPDRPSSSPQAQPAPSPERPRTSPPPPPGAPLGSPSGARPTPPPTSPRERASVLPSAPPTARGAPSRGSDPQLRRPVTPVSHGDSPRSSGLQTPPSGPALPRPVTPVPEPQQALVPLAAPTRSPPHGIPAVQEPPESAEPAVLFDPRELVDREDRGDDVDDTVEVYNDPDPATSPRIRRAPSEPEIETYYELDAEPPPLPEPEDPDDDPIAEMIVSVDDGREVVTEKVTDTYDATVTLSFTEPNEDEVPTRVRARTADDALSVSGTISVAEQERPPASRRPKRVSDSGLEE